MTFVDFDKFLEHCSFDFSETDKKDETQIVVIFSQGFMTYHNSDFVKMHPEMAKRLAAKTLYDYLKERFNE